mmetsp:Transcript_26179/g.73383  ORF Transcript_26179/g.73383 Transcript_26179/m.73383 type:complete len:542 (+) Transcript_26179:221-1846(+)
MGNSNSVPETCKAAVYGKVSTEPSDVKVIDAPVLPAGPGLVIVKAEFASVNPIDYLVQAGHLQAAGWVLPLPFTMGYDIAGKVVAVGKGVAGFKVGDSVFGVNWGQNNHNVEDGPVAGTFKEYVTIKGSMLSHVPKRCPKDKAAAVALVGTTAYQALSVALQVKKGDRITAASTGEHYDIQDLGLLVPEPVATGELRTGQVGYVITGMKTTRSARVGDTWHHYKQQVASLPGFKPAKAMVFAGMFPVSGGDFERLQTAMEQLTLNDSSVAVKRENSDALGAGFRCGFLGLLHLDVFLQRLEQEYGASVITTAPTVPFRVHYPDGKIEEIYNPASFPVGTKIAMVEEPTVHATVILPDEYVGTIMELCLSRRGEQTEHASLGGQRSLLRYTLPLSELGSDFYDALKSRSRGYASFDYEEGEYRPADLQRLDLLINGDPVDALARVVHRGSAQRIGRDLCTKLKELLDQALYEIVIQAAAQGKIVARETLKAMRKNVLAKCYGGDVSRKRKLLEKQKEGKKRMRKLGKVDVPQNTFYEMMRVN